MKDVIKVIGQVPETVEEAYQAIRAYFSKPGAALAKAAESCAYRDNLDNACAVGCLIPDDEYDPGMEFKGVIELSEYVAQQSDRFPITAALLKNEEILSFLKVAQRLHDQIAEDAEQLVTLLDGAYLSWRLHDSKRLGVAKLQDGSIHVRS